MKGKIQKWGNSFGIRLPLSIIKDLELENGSEVIIKEEDNQIIIKAVPKQKKLEYLINDIDDSNIHAAEDWGHPEGNEVW